jgi:PilZ domain
MESATMRTHTVHANLSESITLVCEQCHRSKVLDATVVKDLPQPLKVRCPCGTTFGVNIIIRQFYRKQTRLLGTYVKHDPQTNQILEQGRMIVEDISRKGLGFRTLYRHAILVNDVLSVTFTLDDKQKTDIRKSVRVRRLDDRFIGAEFSDHDAYTDTNRMLGFYLMPR